MALKDKDRVENYHLAVLFLLRSIVKLLVCHAQYDRRIKLGGYTRCW